MKNKAFTLLEVMLAMFILIMSVGILSDLQIKSIFTVWRDREYLDRVFLVKKELLEIFLDTPKSDKPIKTEIEEPEEKNVKIISKIIDIEKKSELRDFIDSVKLIESVGEWQNRFGLKSDFKMISFVLNPEQKEKIVSAPKTVEQVVK
ncbi:prepilin-type N-terminal cleavage/methylation domain-containing protein [Candidatus Babeliales bacterium]|nr:prepilin-type N-terminal cleavage/methylation domain-containing protein [Candidatus Babeliales bacterium]MCF7899758.1 prepilin-type N-terminal cleavage/methylation domain-containing protein [Candidatus Babeliales bacterium]